MVLCDVVLRDVVLWGTDPVEIAVVLGVAGRALTDIVLPGLLPDLAKVLDCFAAAPRSGLTRHQLRLRLHVNGATISLLLKSGLIESTPMRAPRI